MLGETYTYLDNTLICEEVALADIAAREGTPCYVYSRQGILDRFLAYDAAFGTAPHLVCYAVKANSNLSVLRLLSEAGAGFDLVSGGELYRVLKAGGDPRKVVFSGVGKTRQEIEYALETGIHCFNCESESEIALLSAVAIHCGKRARIALRVNPGIDPDTHKHISTGKHENKFGVDIGCARGLYASAAGLPGIEIEGVSCHIGSQMLSTGPALAAARMVIELADDLRRAGIPVRHVDFGGGLGIAYESGDEEPSIADFMGELAKLAEGGGYAVHVEPGRSIVARSGVLLTRVLYRKQTGGKEFVVVDASMAELIRPVLYDAFHDIVPLRWAPERGTVVADVVGPVCESGDFLAARREVANVMPGDLLAVCAAGAYGFVQSSNYNSRPRPAEVLVDGASWRVIRRRETYHDLVRGED